jgi:gamma-glutamyl:cysteine ligase YbdK (ATP-grasp superfamily)
MGVEIDREEFTESDRAAFQSKLRLELDVLADLLERPGFGEGPTTIGAELELDLVDAEGRPCPIAERVLERLPHAEFTSEIDAYNLEYNAASRPLSGRPFAAMRRELARALERAASAAPAGVSPIAIGILPTLDESHLDAAMMTQKPRYRALSLALRTLQEGPFPLDIRGREAVGMRCDDITAEGAASSMQVHLRCAPSDFARTYNAAQLVTAPVLAAAANAPIFLARVLWDETRIALFRQAVDDRPAATADDWRPARVSFGHGWARRGAHELFAEAVSMHAPLLPVIGAEDPIAVMRSGGVPALRELRLHQGTVWRWNRAVYDDAGGGHLRVEIRALPSGPTPIDMAANAAFAVGATLAMREDPESWLTSVTFGQARRNFYEAARWGLDAELLWPRRLASPELRAAPAVVLELCDRAESALVGAGVERTDAAGAIDVIRERARTRLNGAAWQRRSLSRMLERTRSRLEPLRELTLTYLDLARADAPIHSWPLAG